MAGLSAPSSIAVEEETLANSDFSYNLLFFRYVLVFISGLSFIQKVYHNFNNIKSANYKNKRKNESERKGQVYFVDIWYSKRYGLNMVRPLRMEFPGILLSPEFLVIVSRVKYLGLKYLYCNTCITMLYLYCKEG